MGHLDQAGLQRLDHLLPVETAQERLAEAEVGDRRRARVHELGMDGNPPVGRHLDSPVRPLGLQEEGRLERDAVAEGEVHRPGEQV